MKRRKFIQLSAFAAATVSFPFLHSCSSPAGEHKMSQPVFLSRLFDENMIREAGKAYLQKTPSENDDDKLVQLLADNSSIVNSTDEKAIHQYLDKKINHDFETGKTVLVKGWVLAVTEARQCALYSLIKG
ncbi:MAG TPA: hypothetical protein VH396_13215 [Chitinophagaceae bacterium]|jgi:hypothetical protein